jgi:hypothetical protein
MSPRESIAMTADEARSFLGSRAAAVLATVGADGMPDAALAACRVDGDAVVVDDLDARARASIGHDARVAVAVEQCASYYEIRGVTAHGTARDLGTGAYAVALTDLVAFDFAKIRERP